MAAFSQRFSCAFCAATAAGLFQQRLMIGLNHEHLEEALNILRRFGKRVETEYQPVPMTGGTPVFTGETVPVSVCKGGVVLFVLDVAQNEQY